MIMRTLSSIAFAAVVLAALTACSGGDSSGAASGKRNLTSGSHKCTQDEGTQAVDCPEAAPIDHCSAGETPGWDVGLVSSSSGAPSSGADLEFGLCVACRKGETAQEFDCVALTCTTSQECPVGSDCKDGACK
jgi:hypothetical protein